MQAMSTVAEARIAFASACLICRKSAGRSTGLRIPPGRHQPQFSEPSLCNRCNAHVEEGRVVELTVLFADLPGSRR